MTKQKVINEAKQLELAKVSIRKKNNKTEQDLINLNAINKRLDLLRKEFHQHPEWSYSDKPDRL